MAALGHAADPVKPACSGLSGLRHLALLAVVAVIGGLLVLCCCYEDASEAHSADARSATPQLSDLLHAVAAPDPLAEYLSDVVEDGSRTLFVDTDALVSRREAGSGSVTATAEVRGPDLDPLVDVTGTAVYEGLVAVAAPHSDCDPHADGLDAIVLSAAPALDGMPGLTVLHANVDAPSAGAGWGWHAVLHQATPESPPYLLCVLRT
ncbi:hypothetical protein GCM10009608_32410 [Pseudonocardia alaniniphila]